MTLLLVQIIRCKFNKLVKIVLERRWQKFITAYFEDSSQNLLGRTENNRQKIRNTLSSDRELNMRPTKYETGELYCVKKIL